MKQSLCLIILCSFESIIFADKGGFQPEPVVNPLYQLHDPATIDRNQMNEQMMKDQKSKQDQVFQSAKTTSQSQQMSSAEHNANATKVAQSLATGKVQNKNLLGGGISFGTPQIVSRVDSSSDKVATTKVVHATKYGLFTKTQATTNITHHEDGTHTAVTSIGKSSWWSDDGTESETTHHLDAHGNVMSGKIETEGSNRSVIHTDATGQVVALEKTNEHGYTTKTDIDPETKGEVSITTDASGRVISKVYLKSDKSVLHTEKITYNKDGSETHNHYSGSSHDLDYSEEISDNAKEKHITVRDSQGVIEKEEITNKKTHTITQLEYGKDENGQAELQYETLTKEDLSVIEVMPGDPSHEIIKTEIEYAKDGKTPFRIIKTDIDKIQFEYEYSSDGKTVISEMITDSEGNKSTVFYKENGTTVDKMIDVLSDGSTTETIFGVDGKNPLKETETKPDKSSIIKEYDAFGFLKNETETKADQSAIVKEYASQAKDSESEPVLQKETAYLSTGAKKLQTQYAVDGKTKLLEKTFEFNKPKTVTQYKNNQPVSIAQINRDEKGKIESVSVIDHAAAETSTYNAQGVFQNKRIPSKAQTIIKDDKGIIKLTDEVDETTKVLSNKDPRVQDLTNDAKKLYLNS